MYTEELVVGQVYLLKRGAFNRAKGQFLGTAERGFRRKATHYRFKNLLTGRELILKSRVRILGLAGESWKEREPA